MKTAIRNTNPDAYEEAAVRAVADQLATQGLLVQTQLANGANMLVLQLPVIDLSEIGASLAMGEIYDGLDYPRP